MSTGGEGAVVIATAAAMRPITTAPLPSGRHYLSYDDCLEDKRGKLSELFCVVYGSCAQ